MSLGSYRSYPEVNKEYIKFVQCIESGESECRAPHTFQICYERYCTSIDVPSNFYTVPLEYGHIKSGPYQISSSLYETVYKKKSM